MTTFRRSWMSLYYQVKIKIAYEFSIKTRKNDWSLKRKATCQNMLQVKERVLH